LKRGIILRRLRKMKRTGGLETAHSATARL
jgi:hypothetical protein